MAEDNPAPDLPQINLSPLRINRHKPPAPTPFSMSGAGILTLVGFCIVSVVGFISLVLGWIIMQ